VVAVKKLLAVLASLAGLAVTADGYQPLSKRGYLSIYAFSFGVFASELPLQLIAGQFALLAAVTRKLSPRLRRFSWLVSALSWLGLAGLHRIGAQADQPLKAALDAGLGTARRTESGDLWKRPAGAGTAKSPGVLRMARVYGSYARDTDISYGEHGARNHLDIWRRPDLDRGGRAPPGRTRSSMSNVRWRGSRSTSPNTAATRTGSRSPAARPAGICRRWLPSPRMIRNFSPASRTPTLVFVRPFRSTASTTSPVTMRSTR
jgi:hypothetical protein